MRGITNPILNDDAHTCLAVCAFFGGLERSDTYFIALFIHSSVIVFILCNAFLVCHLDVDTADCFTCVLHVPPNN